MKKFEKPYAITEDGKIKFVLWDGTKTKSVFNVADFDSANGVFPILNEQNQVVEYMDLIGNFTKQPTKFAQCFNDYIDSRLYGVGDRFEGLMFFYCRLVDFPSKYLVDKKIRKIVKDEEAYRYQQACEDKFFEKLIHRLCYKLYLREIYKKKIKKAERLIKHKNKLGKDLESVYLEPMINSKS